jgi:hypothetical protein
MCVVHCSSGAALCRFTCPRAATGTALFPDADMIRFESRSVRAQVLWSQPHAHLAQGTMVSL